MGKITRQELSVALRQELDDVYAYINGSVNAEIGTHMASQLNPHNVTKAQIGLGNVIDVKQASETAFNSHTANVSNPHAVTASQIGAVPTTREIISGTGITGGGTLTTNRTISLNTAYTDGRYLLKGERSADTSLFQGMAHTAFHKVGTRFIDMGLGRELFYGGVNDLYFRHDGFVDRRVYHSGNIKHGTALPGNGIDGDIYIQY